MTAHVDIAALYAAVDAARTARRLTWKRVAQEVGIAPSTLTRIGHGRYPDTDGFAAIVHWLGVPAEVFIIADTPSVVPGPEVQLSTLLSAVRGLRPPEREFLQDVLRACLKLVREDRGIDHA